MKLSLNFAVVHSHFILMSPTKSMMLAVIITEALMNNSMNSITQR